MSRCLTMIASTAVLLFVAGCSDQPQKAPSTPTQQDVTQQSAPPKESAPPTEPTEPASTTNETVLEIPSEPAGAATATETEPTTESPESILRRVADFYRDAQQIAVNEEISMRMQMPGVDQKQTIQRSTVIDKPNRISMRSEGMGPMADIISDGETMTSFIAAVSTYTEEAAPESLEALFENPFLMSMNGAGGAFVMNFFADDPWSRLMDGVTGSSYVGRETLDGVDTHRLLFNQERFDWEIWISATGDPLVQQVSVDMTKALLESAPDDSSADDVQMTSIVRFRDWKINEPPAADAFVFAPPEGAEKKDSLFEGFEGGEPELSPLLGEAAPELELELFDGGTMSLAEHNGKDIVMLDFWATWCGPCIRELPVLIEVAKEYKEKGVVFYALNQQEEREDIQEFLDDREMSFPIALDAEADAALAYGVEGIPMLVLIDRSGIVQSVHVGFNPGIDELLRQELDDLLAGKNLAEEALREREEQEAADSEE